MGGASIALYKLFIDELITAPYAEWSEPLPPAGQMKDIKNSKPGKST